MNSENFNWQEFTHAIYIQAPVQHVYEFITTAEGITKWFIGEANYKSATGESRSGFEHVQSGDQFHWKWLEKDLEIEGTIYKAVENQVFNFSFGDSFDVNIEVQQEGVRTRVVLHQTYHEGASENQFNHLNCCTCWVFFMTNLKSVIEFGHDLREVELDEEYLVNQ